MRVRDRLVTASIVHSRSSIRARSCVVVVAAALMLIAAAPADAAIVPGQGIAGVRLGDSGANVQKILSAPDGTQKYSGGESWFWRASADPVDWATVTTRHVVRGLETQSKQQRTSKGIGPGSSLAAVKKAYPGIKCRSTIVGHAACTLTTKPSGKSIPTSFVIYKGKVSMIDIGSIGEFV
jgi:hypothetical protein